MRIHHRPESGVPDETEQAAPESFFVGFEDAVIERVPSDRETARAIQGRAG